MKTYLMTIATLACVALAAAGCSNDTGNAAQRDHSAPAFVLPTLKQRPAGLGDREFAKVQAQYKKLTLRIASNANDVEAYVQMAQILMQEARVTGRHHDYLPDARALLDEALRRDPNNFAGLFTKGSLLMTLHQFTDAKEFAERAVQQNGHCAMAYGVLCDAQVELGQYDRAVASCDTMLAIRPDLRSYARASYQREIHGDRAGAAEAMRLAADAGEFGQEDRAWTLYNLGNLYLNQGKRDTAAFIFRGILEERPGYAYAMSGLAAVASSKGQYAEAMQLLVEASQTSPEHLFIEQLADLYLAMGQKENAATIEKKVIDAFRLHEQGGWNIDREVALFCANHDIELADALMRAKREYDRRPANIDASDTYAWVLYKNGRAAEAVPVIQSALRMGTANGVLHYHAGLIFNAAGNRADAAAQLRMALSESPYLTPITLASARETLASVGHTVGHTVASRN